VTRRNLDRLRRVLCDTMSCHGPLGWWPVRCERRPIRERLGERETCGYHPGRYQVPATRGGRFEVLMGAVLTQNTAWTNVERALDELFRRGVRTPERLLAQEPEQLSRLIRPAGYFNQKARYLRAVSAWFLEHDRRLARLPRTRETVDRVRGSLLGVLGVGPETADSVLLYAYHLPSFVVDAYTRRVLLSHGLCDERDDDRALQLWCDKALSSPDLTETVRAFQEAHAALVEAAKALRSRPRRQ